MSPLKSRQHIAIVGGGIVGAFAAYFLSREGSEVTLIERAGIGSQASGNNPGGINPMHGTGIPGPMQSFAWDSFQIHLAEWATIEKLSGIAFANRRAPRIHVALEKADLAGLARAHDLHNAADGFSACWLDRKGLLALDRRLNPEAISGLFTEGNAKLAPLPFTRAVAAAAQKLGAKIILAEATGIEASGGQVSAVILDDERLQCDGMILATGPWTSSAERWTGFRIPIEAIKGELVLARTSGEPIQHSFAWREASIYGAGLQEVWLGGNEEKAEFDSAPTEVARALILNQVKRLMPGLGITGIVNHIAALRPVTSDDLPIIGFAPEWQNICLAFGGGRKGMLYGAAMGKAAAELIARGKTGLQIAACSPERFCEGVSAS